MKKKIRKISVLVLIGMLVGMGLVGMIPTAVAGTENLPYEDDFEDGNDDGWYVVSGDWTVTPTGEYYQSNDGFQVPQKTWWGYEMISVLASTPPTDDYIIQVRMKQDLGYEYYAGLVFRYWIDQYIPLFEADYYLLILGEWYGTCYLEFWIVKDEDWYSLAETKVDVNLIDWYTLTADVRGETFDFYLNGDLVLSVTDSQLTMGTVGLYTEEARVRFDDWSVGIPVDTNPGVDVEVDPYSNPPVPTMDPYISLEFDQVDVVGETTITASTTNLQPDLSNFYLSISGTPWVYYHITTTAVYTGDITVCITYDDSGMTPEEEGSINIYHWQGNQWVNVTDEGYPDTTNNTVNGTVSSVFHLGTEPPLAMTAGGLDDNPPYYDGFDLPNGPADPAWLEMAEDSDWSVINYEYHQENIAEWYDPDPYSPLPWGYHHIAYIKPGDMPSLTDYRIQVKTKQIAPSLYGLTGLVFRYQDNLNYYMILTRPGNPYPSLSLRIWTNGYIAFRGTVSIRDLTFSIFDWHIITADIRGNKFDFYLDGDFMFQVTDSTHTSGSVGLFTQNIHGVFDDWTAGFPEVTPSGTNVEVDPYPGVSVEFSEVPLGGEGETTAIPSAEYPGPDLGNFFIEEVGNFYDISTTAQYNGIITVGLPYDQPPPGFDESKLNMYHWQGNDWVPLTTVYQDFGNNIIYCEVSSLSWFVVGYLTIDPPEVTLTGPTSGSIFQVDTPVPFTASFIDSDTEEIHTALWEFESGGNIITVPGTVIPGNGGGTVTANYPFETVGVYTVTLTVTDKYGLQGTATTVEGLPAMVVIYDPSGGFVTGGGWIDSPAGAYRGDEGLIGKASFGFVAKYKKGAQVPTGQTEFKFKVADLNFHSSSYQWLIITGAKAQFKGTGTINGGDEYNFKLWATDGALPGGGGEDKFRIKIWYEEVDGDGNEIEHIVYDNGMETPLGGGQIVIHKS